MVESTHIISSESGFSLIEVLTSIVLLIIVTMGLASSLKVAMKVGKLTETHYAASSLAASRVEELAAVDIVDLDDTYDETDTAVTWPGLDFNFLRTTNVTVNADDSRTIDVIVASGNAALPTTVNFSTLFATWE